jgi:hypothetical protein
LQDLKFGFEVEGAINGEKSFSRHMDNYKNNNPEVLLPFRRTGGGGHFDIPSTHRGSQEIKFTRPISQENIFKTIDNLRSLLGYIDYRYHPAQVGLHVHISPEDGRWGKKLPLTYYNLSLVLNPFAKFFKNRREQSYCINNDIYQNILEFISEYFKPCDYKEELQEQIKKFNKLKREQDSSFKRVKFTSKSSNMVVYRSSFDTLEIRLFPPEPDFYDILTKILIGVWRMDEPLDAGEMLDKSIYQVLQMFDLEHEIVKFKKYYEEWIK